MNHLHLLSLLGSFLFSLLVLVEELLERVHIEATSLLVDERSLQQNGVGALIEHVHYLLLGNGNAKLSGIVLDNLVRDVLLPHLILHLVEFILGEVVALGSELNHILRLVNESLKLLNADFLAQHLANLLAGLALYSITGTNGFFGDKCEKAQCYHDDKHHAFASDFS